MTVEQREKIQSAIQALIEVESALMENITGKDTSPELLEIQGKLHAARISLLQLNAPDYN